MEQRTRKSPFKLISRVLVSIAGAILFLYGIIAALSPLPLGVPLMVMGFLMIAGAVPATRPLLILMRRKWPWFNGLVRQISKRMPDRFGALQKETDPNKASGPIYSDKEKTKPKA